MTKQADFKRRVRQRMAKTGESYTTARSQLLAGIASGEPQFGEALHVTNGDSAAHTLRETTYVERVLAWRDALHEGPVPAVEDAELRRIRAAFLAEDSSSDPAPIERSLAERDRELEAARDGDYVLWFEADLYDQLQLVEILARLAALGVAPARITLICIGEHLGIAHFGGLGELTAAQLERVAASAAVSLTGEALVLARAAWHALRLGTPRELGAIKRAQSPELRFVGEAFDRLSREYPSTRDGLSLTERRILAAVAEGASTAGEAFVATSRREARPFLGDSFCYRTMQRLATARVPLLQVVDRSVDRQTQVGLTEAGERVVAGAADHVELNGIDRWIGGVHLVGPGAQWRWHEGTESVVEVGGVGSSAWATHSVRWTSSVTGRGSGRSARPSV